MTTFIIAKKEFKEIVRDGRFRWLSGVLLVLLLAALATGWQYAEQAQNERETAEKADRETWLAQGARNPHSAAHFGHYAFKPTPFLAYIDRGLNSFLGTAIWLEAHSQDPAGFRPAEDATSLQRFGDLTAAWTLQYLIPLFIIIMGFSAFAGEREQGTLKQLKSLGLRSSQLALGKTLGIGAALALALVPVTIVALALLGLSVNADSFPAIVPRLFGLGLIYTLYFIAFFSLTLAVSAKAKTPRLALLVLLGFWIGGGLLLPRLSADVAESVYPTPSITAFWEGVSTDVDEGLDGQTSRRQRSEALQQRVLEQYGVDKVEDLPVNYAGIRLQDSEEYSNLVFDKHYQQLWDTFTNQENLQAFASVLSPSIAVSAISRGFAGTDLHQHRHFADAAELHRRKIVKILNDDLAENGAEAGFGYMADEKLWQDVPQIEYSSPSFSWVLSHYPLQLGILALWGVLSFMIMIRSVNNVRVV